MYLNKVMLIGNLTRDPELKTLPTGTQVATIGVATNRTWKDKNGAKQEDTQFHTVVVFARQAEIVAQYLRKGSQVCIEGRIQTRSWDDKKDGTKKYRTEIVAESIQFGSKREGGPEGIAGAPTSPSKNAPPARAMDTIEYPEEEINPDDIPF